MGILERLAISTGLAVRADVPVATPAAVMPPPRAEAASTTTPTDALTLDAVFRSLQVLQTSALQLTMDVWRGTERLEPTPSLAARPDVFDHAGAFWAGAVASLATRGNAYWLKHRGVGGTVINLEQLDPLDVLTYRDSRTGRVIHSHAGHDYTARDVEHLKFLRIPGQLTGLGPIQACQRTLRGALDVASYGSEWFRTSEVPSGILSTDQTLTPAQAAEWKAQWRAQRQAHDTAVLGSGLTYQHLNLKPSEVQWLESQRFNLTGIARLFGIPSRMLLVGVEGSSDTYANAEREDIAFVRYTLMAYLREIELAISSILPRGQTARFNVDALLRTDTKTRYEAHAIALRANFLTVNEVRAIEGLPALTQAPTQPAPTPAPQPQEITA